MKEVEIKSKVENFDAIIKNLEKLGCEFSDPIAQNDQIFYKKGSDFQNAKKNCVLRIRKQEGKILFTLKKNRSNELDNIEKEIEVSNAEELGDILDLLDYEEVLKINKTRRKCKHKGLEICLDEVEKLGNFIEVEKMSDEDGEKVQAELFNFLKSLGISDDSRVIQGYDTLIYNKNRQVL